MGLIVQKFGGSSVANAERIRNVARIITDTYKAGNDVVVVLSAQGDTTDELIEKAAELNPRASKREMDMLLATGEQQSIALCAMTIEGMGFPVVSLTGWQVGMNTNSTYSNARIKRVDGERIRSELDKKRIVIVAGFQGINKYGDVTTLGRGGSDTSAVALAATLGADLCQIYTDVDGVYTADPRKVKGARKLEEISFDEMLEESIKTIYNGDKVTGYVVAITGTEVSVDIGTKYSGFIPTTEFTDDGIKVEDAVKVGDTIEAVVVRVNDVEGTVMLSKKRLDAAKSWTMVEEAVESGEFLEGTVTEINKGGVVVNVKGVRVFVPASQSGLPKEADMNQLLKQKVRVKITEVNRSRKRVVGSIRAVAQKERREKAEAIWNEMEVGNKYHGVVKSMTSYGAFVDIGGIDGMVHVSEMSWSRIKNPAEVFNIGDEVDVYVISFDKEKKKISLGYKDPNENPWVKFTTKYNVGDTAEVKIVKLMTFGAFAEVLPGVDGLIHISQIANRRIGKPEEVLSVGDVVEAKITAIDTENHKISLSIRALAEPAAAEVEEAPEVEDNGEDALVYEVSTNGEAKGEIVEE